MHIDRMFICIKYISEQIKVCRPRGYLGPVHCLRICTKVGEFKFVKILILNSVFVIAFYVVVQVHVRVNNLRVEQNSQSKNLIIFKWQLNIYNFRKFANPNDLVNFCVMYNTYVICKKKNLWTFTYNYICYRTRSLGAEHENIWVRTNYLELFNLIFFLFIWKF